MSGGRGNSRDHHDPSSSRSSYGNSRGREERGRPDAHNQDSSRGGRSGRGGGSRVSGDSRERVAGRGFNRGGRGGMRWPGESKGDQSFAKRAESSMARKGGGSGGRVQHVRGSSYDKDSRGGRGAGRDRAGPGRSKDFEASDHYGRDPRGGGSSSGDRHRSKSSERRGRGRDIDEDVMRARRKYSGGEVRSPEGTPRRQDARRRPETPASGSTKSKPSSRGRASLTPLKGAGSSADHSLEGASDGSGTRGRGTKGHQPVHAPNTICAQFDQVPLPPSIGYNGMGGDDFISSLEDPLSDSFMCGAFPNVGSPVRRSSRSSSITSPSRANHVSSPAMTAGGGDAAAMASPDAATPGPNTPGAPVPTPHFSPSEPGPTTASNEPEAAAASGKSGCGMDIAPMEGGVILREREQVGNDSVTITKDDKHGTPYSSSLSCLPPAPEEPSAVLPVQLVEAEVAGPTSSPLPKTEQSPQEVVAAAHPSAPPLPPAGSGVEHAGTAEDESASPAATASAGTEAEALRKVDAEKDPIMPCASEEMGGSAVVHDTGPSPAVGEVPDGAGSGLGQAGVSGRCRPELGSGSDDAAAGRGGAAAPNEVEGGQQGKEEDGIQEDEQSAGERTPRRSTDVKSSWFSKGTMVVLHCNSAAQVRSTSTPVLPLSDLIGRPVS